MPELIRRAALAVLLATFAVAPALAQTKTAPAPKAAATPKSTEVPSAAAPEGAPQPGGEEPVAKIEGFRSASFGMTEAQVKAAIRKDFNIGGDKVTVEEHPVERTTAVSVTVNDLLPETGPARVSYILGHKSKKLIQVNVIWGAGQSPTVKPDKLVSAANGLLQYFLAEGFPRDTIIANTRANDGSIVVFRGLDAQKRMALLRLIGAPGEGDDKEKAEKAAQTMVLWLSYVQDIQNPDVFRISKGQF